MLDILMPVGVSDIPNALRAIENLVEFTDVPFRLLVCVDGGTREDVEPLQAFLPAIKPEWNLMQNTGVQGFPFTISELAKSVRNEFVAVVPPNIWVNDPKWFGKMQVVFTKDQHCFMVAGDVPETVMASTPPFKLVYNRHPTSNFFLSRRAAMQNVGEFSSSEDFSRQANQLGGTRWVASGVRYSDAHALKDTRPVESSQGSDR